MRQASRGGLALALAVVDAALSASLSAACGGGAGFFRQYEYEEEMYLSLDGSATLYVSSSIPALNALRGATFDPEPTATIAAKDIRDYFTAPGADVTRVTLSRRNDRRYVHVRMQIADVRRLGDTPRFAWSSYGFARDGDVFVYRQKVGRPATGAGTWQGDELVAFRLHLPSKVVYHNVDRVRRGNILAWEQSLTDRLAGRPIEMEARMETQSILYRTLGLFGVTILLVAATFAVVLWWLVNKSGRRSLAAKPDAGVRPGAHA